MGVQKMCLSHSLPGPGPLSHARGRFKRGHNDLQHWAVSQVYGHTPFSPFQMDPVFIIFQQLKIIARDTGPEVIKRQVLFIAPCTY